MDIVATARTDAEYIGVEKCKERKYVRPFQPVENNVGNYLVSFNASVNETKPANHSSSHARMLSTSSGIDFAEAYQERELDHNQDPITSAGAGAGVDDDNNDDNDESKEHVSDDKKAHVVRWHAKLAQALELEVRTVRPALERDRVIAEVDLISGEYVVEVKSFDVNFEHGVVTMMGDNCAPITLQKHENYSFCFNLQLRSIPQSSSSNHFSARKPLKICLESEVMDQCKPCIETTWTPVINFENSHGPFPKTPALTIPMSSPVPPGPISTTPNPQNSGLGPSQSSDLALINPPRLQNNNLTLMGGLSIVVTGPQFVELGEVFEWEFTIINKSQRNRNFTITFGPDTDNNEDPNALTSVGDISPNVNEPLSGRGFNPTARSPIVGTNIASTTQDIQFASANGPGPIVPSSTQAGSKFYDVFSYNQSYLRKLATAHYANSGTNCGLITLCQELRVGNLAPHVCFQTRISLKALRKGTQSIESSRIEDLTNGDSYEVGGMLDVIVR